MKLVILDRDGVINHDSDEYIKSPEEWQPIEGSLSAISRLNHAGYRVIVSTNQSGIGRGLYSIDTLNKIHFKMHRMLSDFGGHIDAVFFCPHTPEDGCDCRKPKPGMLLSIASRLSISLDKVPVVGDSLRDLQAATAVNAYPVLVRTGKGERTLADPELDRGIPVYDDLASYTDHLLSVENNHK